MIVVDSSVWIEYFRDKNSSIINALNELLDEDCVFLPSPVWIELISGASKKDEPKLKQSLCALPRVYPTRNCWKQIEKWITLAKKKGERFGAFDLMIAAIAEENQASLWSLDDDFKRMQKLKFIKLY